MQLLLGSQSRRDTEQETQSQSQPISAVPTEIVQPEPAPKTTQPTSDELGNDGIKVYDFAYVDGVPPLIDPSSNKDEQGFGNYIKYKQEEIATALKGLATRRDKGVTKLYINPVNGCADHSSEPMDIDEDESMDIDEDEGIKTPLLTANGSLMFENEGHLKKATDFLLRDGVELTCTGNEDGTQILYTYTHTYTAGVPRGRKNVPDIQACVPSASSRRSPSCDEIHRIDRLQDDEKFAHSAPARYRHSQESSTGPHTPSETQTITSRSPRKSIGTTTHTKSNHNTPLSPSKGKSPYNLRPKARLLSPPTSSRARRSSSASRSRAKGASEYHTSPPMTRSRHRAEIGQSDATTRARQRGRQR